MEYTYDSKAIAMYGEQYGKLVDFEVSRQRMAGSKLGFLGQ
jgi:hypothetical protein